MLMDAAERSYVRGVSLSVIRLWPFFFSIEFSHLAAPLQPAPAIRAKRSLTEAEENELGKGSSTSLYERSHYISSCDAMTNPFLAVSVKQVYIATNTHE